IVGRPSAARGRPEGPDGGPEVDHLSARAALCLMCAYRTFRTAQPHAGLLWWPARGGAGLGHQLPEVRRGEAPVGAPAFGELAGFGLGRGQLEAVEVADAVAEDE